MTKTFKMGVLGLAMAASFVAASPALAETQAEAANKKLVLDFYAALNDADATHSMKERIQGIAERYLAADYLQHSEGFQNLPGTGTARDKLIHLFQSLPPMPQSAEGPKTVAVMAEGDLVMMLTSRTQPDPATGAAKTSYIFNMFRARDGRLVEHWDVAPAPMGGAPPPGGPPVGPPRS